MQSNTRAVATNGQGNSISGKGRAPEAEENALESEEVPRLYFSTESHLYELPYRREEIGYQEGRLRDEPLYRLAFPWPLKELPFTGSSWYHVVGDLGETGGHGTYFHLSSTYDPAGKLGNFSRVTHGLEPADIRCVVLLRPSHTPPAIADLMAAEGEVWHISALERQWLEGAPPPPEPSAEIQLDEQENALYDLFARGRHGAAITLATRLSGEEALRLGIAIAQEEQGILLRDHEPDDTLEWITEGVSSDIPDTVR